VVRIYTAWFNVPKFVFHTQFVCVFFMILTINIAFLVYITQFLFIMRLCVYCEVGLTVICMKLVLQEFCPIVGNILFFDFDF
jgi:hypothetical protein